LDNIERLKWACVNRDTMGEPAFIAAEAEGLPIKSVLGHQKRQNNQLRVFGFKNNKIINKVPFVFKQRPGSWSSSVPTVVYDGLPLWQEWIERTLHELKWPTGGIVTGAESFSPPGAYIRPAYYIPDDMGNSLVCVNERYKYISDKYSFLTKQMFDNEINIKPESYLVKLDDLSFMMEDIQKIADNYNCDIFETAVYRSYATDMDSQAGTTVQANIVPDEQGNVPFKSKWYSEMWHFDNHGDDTFKILVYLSDVENEDHAPFQYKTPVEFIPTYYCLSGYKDKPKFRSSLSATCSRLNYGGPSNYALGPKGTTIMFKNSNVVHKGNFCRKGYRDIFSVQLKPKQGVIQNG